MPTAGNASLSIWGFGETRTTFTRRALEHSAESGGRTGPQSIKASGYDRAVLKQAGRFGITSLAPLW
jgi:hypothetical protein